jgi:hypothetical protein
MEMEVPDPQQMQNIIAQQQAQLAHLAGEMAQHEAAMQAQLAAEVEQLHNNAHHWQAAQVQAAAEAVAAAAAAAQAAAPAAGVVGGAPGALPRGYRAEGPPKFTGAPGEDVEAWLFQLEEANSLFPIADEQQRIRYTALSLRGTAAKWYAAVQRKDPPEIDSWATFVRKLKQQFLDVRHEWIARTQLIDLRQVGSVRDYTVKFRNLQIQISDMSTTDLLDKYIRGLKDFAHKVWRRHYVTLDEAMIYAEELDLEIRQKRVLGLERTPDRHNKSGGKPTRATPSYAPNASRHIPWQPRQEPRSFHRGGPTPMELGVLRMSETERNRHMQQDLCFTCHKPGHRANVCPSKIRSGNGDRRR